MSLLEELRTLGVDVDEGLERVMDDKALYETMLGMFPERVASHPIAPEDFDAEDVSALTAKVHTLKGVTGNLAMTQLFTGYVQTLDRLRAGQAKEAAKAYEQIVPAQKAILECIERFTITG